VTGSKANGMPPTPQHKKGKPDGLIGEHRDLSGKPLRCLAAMDLVYAVRRRENF